MHTRSLLLATVLFSASFAAHADVVFTNINNIDCFCGNSTSLQGPTTLAEAFTPTGDYLLTGATARLTGLGDPASADFSLVDFSIYNDASGVPGTALLDLGTATVTTRTFYTQTVAPTLQLLAGQQYWLVLAEPSTGDSARFQWEGAASSGVPFAFRDSPTDSFSGPYLNALQFSIAGNPTSVAATPEPETLMLLLPALVRLPVALRSRRSRAAAPRA